MSQYLQDLAVYWALQVSASSATCIKIQSVMRCSISSPGPTYSVGALPLIALPFAACRAFDAHTVCLAPLCMGRNRPLMFLADRPKSLLLQHSDNDVNVRKHIIKKQNSLHSMLLLIPYNDMGTTTDPLPRFSENGQGHDWTAVRICNCNSRTS